VATSFGHNGHHQAISQKLKKGGAYSAKLLIYMGSHLHLFPAFKCAIYSMMCRSSVMYDVSTFKSFTL